MLCTALAPLVLLSSSLLCISLEPCLCSAEGNNLWLVSTTRLLKCTIDRCAPYFHSDLKFIYIDIGLSGSIPSRLLRRDCDTIIKQTDRIHSPASPLTIEPRLQCFRNYILHHYACDRPLPIRPSPSHAVHAAAPWPGLVCSRGERRVSAN